MRTFLNFLALLGLMSGAAEATQFVRPYGPSDYLGGSKAVGAKVNAEFAYISSWLNQGNIASQNVAAFGIYNANLAVANTKVTDFSGLSGLFVLSGSTTLRTITNLSTTITTSGRPVRLSLQNSGSTANCGTGNDNYSYFKTTGGTGNTKLYFIRDTSTTMGQFYNQASGNIYQCEAAQYVDFPAAGTYTYSVKISSVESVAAWAFTMCNCRLVVWED